MIAYFFSSFLDGGIVMAFKLHIVHQVAEAPIEAKRSENALIFWMRGVARHGLTEVMLKIVDLVRLASAAQNQ